MESDYSFEALTEFLKYVADHGLWKANTAVGYRTAASKIEGDLTEQEAADVREIELDLVFQRYVNRNKLKVSPSTLSTYKRRLRKAIDEFVRYRNDPMNYRPQLTSAGRQGSATEAGSPGGGRAGERAPKTRRATETVAQPSGPPSSSTPMLTVPFPLRHDFLASVQIPRDLRKGEAERLAAFINTLAMDEAE